MKFLNGVKKVITAVTALPFIIKFVLLASIIILGITIFDMAAEWIQGIFTPQVINDVLEIEEVKELVEIKQSTDGSGYYLDFKDNFNEKINEIIEAANRNAGIHNLPESPEFLKNIIKAEVITQFPNLGGNIPEGSNGFQGAIDIRRVTPNKQIGSVTDNPGRGETTTLEPDITYDTTDSNIIQEERVKNWESGKRLVIRGKAYVYEQKESDLNPGSDTGNWKKVTKADNYETIREGTEVTYTGVYKVSANPIYKNQAVVYVQIKYEEQDKFVLATNLKEAEQIEEAQSQQKNMRVSSREEQERTNKYAGKDANTQYKIAIAAGRNNSDDKGITKNGLVEEELTIKVAEKVEELLSEYTNVTVVQVGSTSQNKSGVKVGERTSLARNANPDMCIQIYFNENNGVETIFKDGDGVSSQLAQILSEEISNAMGVTNLGHGTDLDKCGNRSLEIIESYSVTKFPSVVTKGKFLDGQADDTVDKYAKGLVKGILEYLSAEHAGYTSSSIENQTSQTSIESKVYNLKYVKPEQMDEYINNGNIEALKVYTLDESRNLVTATWERTEDGNIKLKKNATMDFSTALQKYVMPYEYLLYFYIDTNTIEFVEKLAQEVFNTEIVIAVQDNVITNKVVDVTKNKKVASDSRFSRDWYEVEGGTSTKITETCSPKIEITYADTWIAKFAKSNSYSSNALQWDDNQNESIINISGNVNVIPGSSSQPERLIVDDGIGHTGELDRNQNPITYTYDIYERIDTTTTTMNIKYDSGSATTIGNENKFVDAYIDTNVDRIVRKEGYLFHLLENNEKTANLLDLTKYLMFKATNVAYDDVDEYDFNQYNLESFSNANSSREGGISLVEPVLSRDKFIEAMQNYATKSGNAGFINNFLPYAEEIYDVSIESGVNPELVVVTAKTEQNFVAGGGSYNYWGIAVYNDSNSGSSFSSLSDGIRAYADVINSYNPGGSQSRAY